MCVCVQTTNRYCTNLVLVYMRSILYPHENRHFYQNLLQVLFRPILQKQTLCHHRNEVYLPIMIRVIQAMMDGVTCSLTLLFGVPLSTITLSPILIPKFSSVGSSGLITDVPPDPPPSTGGVPTG